MFFVAGPAHAQASRTWVSGVGDDANPCSRTAPCKTFAGAISKTALNGEINCLDPGGFGAVTITKSITIDCHEVFASILNAGINGINISFDNFTSPGEVRKTVRLRNINFNGFDSGLGGIRIFGGTSSANSTVVVEDCMIDGNFGSLARGIDDTRSGGGRLIVTNTTIRNNGGGGVSVFPSSGSTNIQVLLNDVRSYHNGTGAQFGAGVRAMIDRSAFAGNSGGGVRAETGAIVNATRSVISHNVDGLAAAGGSITISNNDIAFNTSSGISVIGGTVNSFGNNRISNNASPGTVPSLIGGTSNPTGQQ
jgi:hypothetical protein